MPRKLSPEEAINKMKELEPNYDFSKFIYTRSADKSIIICDKGHEYLSSHNVFVVMGCRCPECAKLKNNIKISLKLRLSQEEAISRMKSIKPNYDFSKFIYNGYYKKSTVICDKGHEFETSYHNIKKNYSCMKCHLISIGNKLRLSQEEAISRMKSIKPNYDFSKFIYKGSEKKSTVICDKGHEFEKTYHSIYSRNSGCPYCSGNIKKSQEEAITILKLLEPKYDFSKFIYINSSTKSTVICDKGHEFETTINKIKIDRRCPYCSHSKSKPETEIINHIKSFYGGNIEQSNRKIIFNNFTNRYLEIDVYLPELKFAIEFNGIYYHTDDIAKKRGWTSIKEYHDYKNNECKKLGIKLVHIEEKDWIRNKDRVLSRIKHDIERRLK